MTIPLCNQEHARLLAGTCPWCRTPIVQGQVALERHLSIVSASHSEGELSARDFDQLKRKLHRRLLDWLVHHPGNGRDPETHRREMRRLVERLCDSAGPPLNQWDREKIIDEVVDLLLGIRLEENPG